MILYYSLLIVIARQYTLFILFCYIQSDHLFLKKKNNPKPVTETPENFCIYINFMKQLKTNIEKKVLNSKIVMNLCKVLNSMIIMSVFQCL